MVPLFSSALSVSANLCFCMIGRIIDNKTLRLITATSESSYTEKEHLDSNLRGIFLFLSYSIYFLQIMLCK